ESLLGVASHRDPASLGPEGYPIDWHGVRAFYRVLITEPTEPQVAEQGGSTARADWFAPDQVAGLALTEVTAEALATAGDTWRACPLRPGSGRAGREVAAADRRLRGLP